MRKLCSGVNGPYWAKILADLGVDVTKIEAPGIGEEARYMGPFAGGDHDTEKSGLFLYLNTNKRRVMLDAGKPKGKGILGKLIKNADILIEDRPPGYIGVLGLGFGDLKRINSGLIMTSFMPFGLSGPYKNYKAYPFNTARIRGQGYLLPFPSPNPSWDPVMAGDHASDYDPGLEAPFAILAVALWKGVSGRDQFIELSKQETFISMQRVESVTYANDDVYLSRTGGLNPMPGGLLPCKERYVVTITPQDINGRP